jgi:hypothetical protein
MRAALAGSREAGSAFGVGDPWLSWLYQPAVRTFRVRLYGDDLSFLQAGHPAVFVSDSSFSAFYPDYHKPTDTADKLDAAALERMGTAALGVVRALERVPRGPAEDSQWYALGGRVMPGLWLVALGALAVVPGLWRASRAGAPALALRAVQALLAGVLLFRHPVPALFVLLLPLVLLPFRRNGWLVSASLVPLASLAALGLAAWQRGAVNGFWLEPWEMGVALAALVLAFAGLGGGLRRTRAPRASRRGRGR